MKNPIMALFVVCLRISVLGGGGSCFVGVVFVLFCFFAFVLK